MGIACIVHQHIDDLDTLQVIAFPAERTGILECAGYEVSVVPASLGPIQPRTTGGIGVSGEVPIFC
jgi:hypothetical protein